MLHFAFISRALMLVILLVGVSTSMPAEEPTSSPEKWPRNPGAEDGTGDQPSDWKRAWIPANGLRMIRSQEKPHAGSWSLLIENTHRYGRPVANNFRQTIDADLKQKSVRLTAMIRTENADSVNVCLQCWNRDQSKMVAFTSTPIQARNQDWSLGASDVLRIPADAEHIVIRAAMTGTGKAWFDDIRVVETRDVALEQKGEAELPLRRGVAVLSSSLQDMQDVRQVLHMVKNSQFNFVVIDFAWITYHWPRTQESTVDLVRMLHDRGIEVALMFRPRILQTAKDLDESPPLLESDSGSLRGHLDFSEQKSRDWASSWGPRLLKKFPSVNEIILYNVLGSPDDRETLLKQCKSDWEKLRPGLRLSHVGVTQVGTSTCDDWYPFFTVRLDESGQLRAASQAVKIQRATQEFSSPRPTTLLKVDWGNQSNASIQEIAAAVDACEAHQLGFILWHYDHLFENPAVFDARRLTQILAVRPDNDPTRPPRPVRQRTRIKRPNTRPSPWFRILAGPTMEERPQLLFLSRGKEVGRIPSEAESSVLSYLQERQLGAMPHTSVSLDDTNRTYLRFSGDLIDSMPSHDSVILVLQKRRSTIPLSHAADIQVHAVLDTWAESELRWTNQPNFDANPMANWTVPVGDQTLRFDVTHIMPKDEQGRFLSLNLVLKSDGKSVPKTEAPDSDTSNGSAFRSRQRDLSSVPKLRVPPADNDLEPLPWPHQPPDATENEIQEIESSVWVINDSPLFQADELDQRSYLHGGLDIVLENGTPIYAMKDGWVRSTQHGTVTVADAENETPCFGWEYTHLGNIRVTDGQHVQRGDLLGVVQFSGLPHLHLTKVHSEGEHWGNCTYVCYPNGHFQYIDTQPPVLQEPIRFVPNEGDQPFAVDASGTPIVHGAVDIVAAIRDAGEFAQHPESGFGNRLSIASLRYELVQASTGTKWQFKSFDFPKLRYRKSFFATDFNTRQAKQIYKHWRLFEPTRSHGNAHVSYYVVTNAPPEGPPLTLDRELTQNCWNTTEKMDNGKSKFPNGEYHVTVTATDHRGNSNSLSSTVQLRNPVESRTNVDAGKP